MFCPLQRWETVYKECGDAETHFEVHPEGFRMLFYVYFIFFFILANVISSNWGDLDLEDNPIFNRFGSNNPCVYFDGPPVSLFASTLWFPGQILLLLFEVFDFLRIRDHYLDGDDRYPISKGFFIYYSISTVIEIIAVVCFSQIFATSPYEHIYMHSIPYYVLICALWLMVLKRFLYLRKVRIVPWYGVFYVILLCISSLIMMGLGIPNLFGARLWESHPWTATLAVYNPYTTLCTFGPLIIYAVIGQELDTLVFTVNRNNE